MPNPRGGPIISRDQARPRIEPLTPHPVGDDAADVVIVGGGIVGLATAFDLLKRFPGKRVVVLEKEPAVASHQTGHNSGVVHSGIYYRPGSLKAVLTRRGVELLRAFCEQHGVEYVECGKVIVATDEAEARRLERLHETGVSNGVPGTRLLSRGELGEIEPHASGVLALHSPSTAIVDYRLIGARLAELLEAQGARVLTGRRVTAIRAGAKETVVTGPDFELRARFLVNAAGLHSDRVARMAGVTPSVRIVPFRGEYYMLRPEHRHLVKGLIYPVPDPALPFLGVHFTTTVAGEVEAGPNAVFAFAREGYSAATVELHDLAETLGFPGFWRLARSYWPIGAYEAYRSLVKGAFVRSLRKLVPAVDGEHLARGHAGVRAQAVDRSGRLVDDFAIAETERSLHILNAPSPAATASLAIGERIGSLLQRRLAPD